MTDCSGQTTMKIVETDPEILCRTLREVEELLLRSQQFLTSQQISMRDPHLLSVCRARVRVLSLLLHQCGSRLSTSEYLLYHSHSQVLSRFLRGSQ